MHLIHPTSLGSQSITEQSDKRDWRPRKTCSCKCFDGVSQRWWYLGLQKLIDKIDYSSILKIIQQISIVLNYLLLKANLRFKNQHAVWIFYESRNFKGITACNCLNINMRCSITAFYRIKKWHVTVLKVNVCSCRTFLPCRLFIFIIIYIFK